MYIHTNRLKQHIGGQQAASFYDTATPCNTLQLPRTHCNAQVDKAQLAFATPQYTATHCNTLQHTGGQGATGFCDTARWEKGWQRAAECVFESCQPRRVISRRVVAGTFFVFQLFYREMGLSCRELGLFFGDVFCCCRWLA